MLQAAQAVERRQRSQWHIVCGVMLLRLKFSKRQRPAHRSSLDDVLHWPSTVCLAGPRLRGCQYVQLRAIYRLCQPLWKSSRSRRGFDRSPRWFSFAQMQQLFSSSKNILDPILCRERVMMHKIDLSMQATSAAAGLPKQALALWEGPRGWPSVHRAWLGRVDVAAA